MTVNSDHVDGATLLSAMDGVAYIVSPEGTILAAGGTAWDALIPGKHAVALARSSVIGKSLLGMCVGEDVLRAQSLLHDSVVQGRLPSIAYTYRCDAPNLERTMRMAITPVETGRKLPDVLYQSTLLSSRVRPNMPLYESGRIMRGTEAEQQALVTVCSYCMDVAWPMGAMGGDRVWISGEEYYRRGGSSGVLVSHGMCPSCYNRIVGSAKAASLS